MIDMSIPRHGWLVIAASAVVLSGCVPAEESTQPAEAAEPTSTTEVAQATVDVVNIDQGSDSQQGVRTLELVNSLTQQVQELTGKVEVLEFELEQNRTRQRQLYDDLDRRMRQLERQVHGDVSPETEQPEVTITLDPVIPAEDQSPSPESDSQASGEPLSQDEGTQTLAADPAAIRAIYDNGFQDLREGRYEDAVETFGKLVRDYPDSDLVDDSLYWIAEANYVTKDLEAALPAFERVIREFPESQRSPEAILKIGYIYYDREQFEQAADYLQEVIDKFPASRSAFSARRRLNKMERDNQIQ